MSVAAASGVERIARAFARAKAERRLALVAYVMAGYPDLRSSVTLARAALDSGADVLELGVPFSDPLADGATLQRASERALANGVRVRDALAAAGELARDREAPILLMGYANPFHAYGLPRLVDEARASRLGGFVVPDLPHEEAGELDALCARAGLARVELVAPTTTDDRLSRIVPRSAGFVYCVSLTGVTGARATLGGDVPAFVGRVRRHATVPIVVGFGISRAEHVAALRGVADGVVVASALVDAIAGAAQPERAFRAKLVELREACRQLP